MATEQLDFQIEVPVKAQKKSLRDNPSEPPLTMLLQQAKFQMIKATNDTMRNYGIPAAMMDGIVAGILADLRSQVSADLLVEIKKQSAGEKNE